MIIDNKLERMWKEFELLFQHLSGGLIDASKEFTVASLRTDI
jgi:hypothetical protein